MIQATDIIEQYYNLEDLGRSSFKPIFTPISPVRKNLAGDRPNRNKIIFYRAIDLEEPLVSIARRHGLTSSRIRQIVLREARTMAPKLFSDLKAIRYESCNWNEPSKGPSMMELRLFKDQFLFGEIVE